MKKDNLVYINQINDFINDIESYISDMNFDIFDSDYKTQDAVLRKLGLIGEAAKKLDQEFIKKYPNFPIKEAISIRNKMIHEYDDIDLRIIWDTIQKDLPLLKNEIKHILG